jgi:hypothetical protein
MAYGAEISRNNPTCFLFLVDQSASMADSFGASPSIEKAGFVADALNKALQNLVIECAKSEGIRDYFWVGVVGYGARVGPAFTGTLTGRDLVPIHEVADQPARVEDRKQKQPDGTGGLVEMDVKFPIWFTSQAENGTPMCAALSMARDTLAQWIDQHPESFPPVVLHLTDGESTDGDPSSLADELRALSTSDGNVLLFNLHVSSTKASPISFPSSRELLPKDDFAHLLFELSSALPPPMFKSAQAAGYAVEEGARGFVFNGGIEEIVSFLEIGTKLPNLR